MPALLGLLVFSVLLTPGDSLECETCTGPGLNCTGTMVNCSAAEDRCAVAVVEVTVADGPNQEIMKGCLSPGICGLEPFYLNLGKMFTARGKVVCCEGDDCASVSPQVPPISSKSNGKKCPACFTQNFPCSTEEVECTGDEDHCLDATLKSGVNEIIVKGCTSKSYCAAVQEMMRMTFHVTASETLNAQCKPANKAPPSSRFRLLALLGLLAVKILL
ncbi:phospholipase A2 inhibitor gamma subunit B-like isoform X1 [Podarcis muralis]